MAKYRPVYTKIWKDPDFEEYSPDAKLLFLYLCTNQQTTDSGIYPITCKVVSNETGLSMAVVKKLLSNNSIKNILYDEENRLVFVVKFKRYNKGGRPELVKQGIVNDFLSTSQSYLWGEFIKEYPEYEEDILTSGIPLAPNPNPILFYSNPKLSYSNEQLPNGLPTVGEPLPNRSNDTVKKEIDDELINELKNNYPDIDIDFELDKYLHYQSEQTKNKKHKDQQRGFRNWVKQADKWRMENGQKRSAGETRAGSERENDNMGRKRIEQDPWPVDVE